MPQIHAVLKVWHPMIGVDRHTVWPPPSPAPGPPAPFMTFHVLIGLGLIADYAKSHCSMGYGWTMKKGTDIGFLIPHIGPPSLLTPLDIIFSASKSYFGSARNPVEGKPVACALAVIINPNLNCGSPYPFSVGFVRAFNTHMVSMSWGDLLAGLLSFAIDFILQCAIAKLLNMGGDALIKRIAPQIMSKQAIKAGLRGTVKNNVINQVARAEVARRLALSQRFMKYLPFLDDVARVNPTVNSAIGTAVGFVFGGPMGLDMGAGDVIPTPGGAITKATQDRLDNSSIPKVGSDPNAGPEWGPNANPPTP